MNNTATFRRDVAAIGLVTNALLMTISVMVAPEFPSGFEERLAAIDAAGTQGKISAVTFALAQLPLLAGVLGIGHLLRGRAPTLSNLGTSLAVIGAFGHSVFGGLSMAYLAMAADQQNRATHAALMQTIESGPAVAFMAIGLLGTVFGILLLAIGLWRAKVAPRWAAPVLGAFLVVGFAGSAVSDRAEQWSVIFYLAAFTALAVTIWRSPKESWRQGVDATAAARVPATPSSDQPHRPVRGQPGGGSGRDDYAHARDAIHSRLPLPGPIQRIRGPRDAQN
jgi:hypothetical protein